MKSFASDNYSGIHPEILEAIQHANQSHEISYAEDTYTEKTNALFREIFGAETEVLYVFNGTGANVIALKCALLPFRSCTLCRNSAYQCRRMWRTHTKYR